MLGFFLNWILTATLLLSLGTLFPGDIYVGNFFVAMLTALVLGVVNAFLRPVIKFLTFPINLVSLGLFSFVINSFILMLVAMLVPGFVITSFVSALLASVLLAVVNLLLSLFGWQSRMI